MKRASLLVMVLMLGVLAAAPALAAVAPSSPFEGNWIGQDPAPPDGDGSTVHLAIEGTRRVRIGYVDDFGSVCVNAGSVDTVFTSNLTGAIRGDSLNASFRSARCGSVIIRFLIGESYTLEYDDHDTPDLSDDTLWDGSIVWHRDN